MLDGEARKVARNIAEQHGFVGKRMTSFLQHVEDLLEAAGGVFADTEHMEPEDPNDPGMAEALSEWVDRIFVGHRVH